jgi:hypothetical protein
MKVDGKAVDTATGKVAPPSSSPEYDGAEFKFTTKKSSYLRIVIEREGFGILGVGKLYLNTVPDGSSAVTIPIKPPEESKLVSGIDETAAVDLELNLAPINT